MASLSFTVKNQAIQVCNLQTQIMSKVLKQSTLNQLQEQLQELGFQQRYHTFLSAFPLGRFFDKLETKDSHIS